jgi:hypothetical protein
MQYKSLTVDDFVPPLLHLEMGMVNLAWDAFELWIDNDVEMIPLHEQDAHQKVLEAARQFDIATTKKKEAEQTINVDIRAKKAEIKMLKMQLR